MLDAAAAKKLRVINCNLMMICGLEQQSDVSACKTQSIRRSSVKTKRFSFRLLEEILTRRNFSHCRMSLEMND